MMSCRRFRVTIRGPLDIRKVRMASVVILLVMVWTYMYIVAVTQSPHAKLIERIIKKKHMRMIQHKIDPFSFKINEKNICSRKRSNSLEILVAIVSSLDEYWQRDYIRATWGSDAKKNPKLSLLFIVGISAHNKLNSTSIQEESEKFGDIIQANFYDTFQNLTLKSLALMQWVSTYCGNAKYVLKIDSDMKTDLEPLLLMFEQFIIPDKFLCGKIMNNFKLNQKPETDILYPFDEGTVFPPYCHGPAYIVSQRIVRKLVSHSLHYPPLEYDDLYITGLLRVKIKEKLDNSVIYFNHEEKQEITEYWSVGNVYRNNSTPFIKRTIHKEDINYLHKKINIRAET